MNLLATLLLSIFMSLGLSPQATFMVWGHEDDLLQDIGRLIEGAIRAATGEDEAPPARAIRNRAAQNGAKPSERDQKEYKDRVEAYARAFEAWVGKVCELTDEQKGRIIELVDAQITSEATKFKSTQGPNQQNQMLPQTLPLLFNTPSGLAPSFQKVMLKICNKELLTEDQIQRLEAALNERDETRNRAYLTYVVAIVDKELFLTSEQRLALVSELQKRKSPMRHPLYSFQPQAYYLPYESISMIIPSSTGKDILNPAQRKRLQDLSSEQQGGQQLVFQTASGRDEWERQIAAASSDQRERYLRAAAVRVVYYEKEMQLSPEQIERLSIAGKGATVRALGDWKDATRLTIEQMEKQMAQMGGNFGFCAAAMDTRTIDQNAIWSDAISTITEGAAKDRLAQRTKSNREATAGALLAMLDDELWLTPDQREPLQKLVQNCLPKDNSENQNPYDQYLRDLVLITYPLMKVSEKSRNEVLTEPQNNVWKQMQSYFQWQKQNNYVQIPLRNNGGSFGFVLNP